MDTGKVNYNLLELDRSKEILSELQKELESKGIGKGGTSLRHKILGCVVNTNYDLAVEEIDSFINGRQEYPSFRIKSARYVMHCKDLIRAIKIKRDFPRFVQLSISKQQELYDKVLEHFEELKIHLRKIEMIERDVKLNDARSTVMVIRAAFNCLAFILIVAFFLEFFTGLGESMSVVTDDLIAKLINKIL